MTKRRLAFSGALALISASSASATVAQQAELLAPQQAFRLTTRVIDARTLEARWQIAEGYYLYRHRFKFESAERAVALGPPLMPHGETKNDPYFGHTEIYTRTVSVRLPLEARPAAAQTARLRITAQGCNAPVGVCYPPITKEVIFELPAIARAIDATGVLLAAGSGLRELIAPPEPGREFLPADSAFALSMQPAGTDALLARFVIADGYYLYRDSLRFALTPMGNVTLGGYTLPPGRPKTDEYFGQTAVYYRQVEVRLAFAGKPAGTENLSLRAGYQGCADRGICYPPITKRFTVEFRGGAIMAVTPAEAVLPPSSTPPGQEPSRRGLQ